jgi:hypothetical protein
VTCQKAARLAGYKGRVACESKWTRQRAKGAASGGKCTGGRDGRKCTGSARVATVGTGDGRSRYGDGLHDVEPLRVVIAGQPADGVVLYFGLGITRTVIRTRTRTRTLNLTLTLTLTLSLPSLPTVTYLG